MGGGKRHEIAPTPTTRKPIRIDRRRPADPFDGRRHASSSSSPVVTRSGCGVRNPASIEPEKPTIKVDWRRRGVSTPPPGAAPSLRVVSGLVFMDTVIGHKTDYRKTGKRLRAHLLMQAAPGNLSRQPNQMFNRKADRVIILFIDQHSCGGWSWLSALSSSFIFIKRIYTWEESHQRDVLSNRTRPD